MIANFIFFSAFMILAYVGSSIGARRHLLQMVRIERDDRRRASDDPLN